MSRNIRVLEEEKKYLIDKCLHLQRNLEEETKKNEMEFRILKKTITSLQSEENSNSSTHQLEENTKTTENSSESQLTSKQSFLFWFQIILTVSELIISKKMLEEQNANLLEENEQLNERMEQIDHIPSLTKILHLIENPADMFIQEFDTKKVI